MNSSFLGPFSTHAFSCDLRIIYFWTTIIEEFFSLHYCKKTKFYFKTDFFFFFQIDSRYWFRERRREICEILHEEHLTILNTKHFWKKKKKCKIKKISPKEFGRQRADLLRKHIREVVRRRCPRSIVDGIDVARIRLYPARVSFFLSTNFLLVVEITSRNHKTPSNSYITSRTIHLIPI